MMTASPPDKKSAPPLVGNDAAQSLDEPARDASAETASEERWERWEPRYPRVRASISARGDIRLAPLEYVDRYCGFHCEIEIDVSTAESARDEVAAALRGVIKQMLTKRVKERGSR